MHMLCAGCNVKTAVVTPSSSQSAVASCNDHVLSTEGIIRVLEEHGAEISLVLLPGVQFYTGQAFDIDRITTAAHQQGCFIGWDLAHAVGNIPLRLHDWEVDFACWCSYKYLNSGPGAIGGAFLHARHGNICDALLTEILCIDACVACLSRVAANKSQRDLPRLAGWWGQEPRTRFQMLPDWHMKPGAQSYQVSAVLSIYSHSW